jgi:DNA repair exonuclease SbcCD nuclease subunit
VTKREEDEVALRLLHTADWHLGKTFPSFDAGDQLKLTRARLDVLDHILGAAEQHAVDAILCAGDLFDIPNPERDWWEPVAAKLATRTKRPTFLLPGNHDPLFPGSVYYPDSPFRRALPSWVKVVDRDDFSYELNDAAVLYARPCRSKAGQDDPALALPSRASGDDKIRIGLVHGSTFDAPGCQTNFPIAKDAAARRGFDYLAIGDTHSFRLVPPDARPPVVYPGAPESTSFDEPDSGNVAVVFVTHSRKATVRRERVAYWTWAERTVRTLSELRALRSEQNLARAVMRLVLDLRLSASEYEEAEAILRELKGKNAVAGRVGILRLDRNRMLLDTDGIENSIENLPDVLRATFQYLKDRQDGEQSEIARAALYHLYRLVREASAP